MFAVNIDPLLFQLGPLLSGIQLSQKLLKFTSFVDDLNIALTCHDEVKAVNQKLSEYCDSSGAALNQDKSKALPLGTWVRSLIPWPM